MNRFGPLALEFLNFSEVDRGVEDHALVVSDLEGVEACHITRYSLSIEDPIEALQSHVLARLEKLENLLYTVAGE